MPTCDPLRNIFEEDHGGSHLSDDAEELGLGAVGVSPRAGIVVPEPLTGGGEAGAREARNCDIHDSAPASAVEGCKIVPDRSSVTGRFFKSHENGRRDHFPLNMHHACGSAIKGGEGEDGGAIEHADAAAEAGDAEVARGLRGVRDVEPHCIVDSLKEKKTLRLPKMEKRSGANYPLRLFHGAGVVGV